MGGWFNWVFDVLGFFGLYYKDATILFLGLDNAGKTTLLMKLRDGTLGTHSPTFHPNCEDLIIGSTRFQTHDLGGHEAARRLWQDYFTKVDGVVYIVDAMDRERFPEAKRELNSLMMNDMLQRVPFLVLGNKIDQTGAVSEHQLCSELGLFNLTGKEHQIAGVQPVEVFMCSVVRGMGYQEGLEWFSSHIN